MSDGKLKATRNFKNRTTSETGNSRSTYCKKWWDVFILRLRENWLTLGFVGCKCQLDYLKSLKRDSARRTVLSSVETIFCDWQGWWLPTRAGHSLPTNANQRQSLPSNSYVATVIAVTWQWGWRGWGRKIFRGEMALLIHWHRNNIIPAFIINITCIIYFKQISR